MKEGRLSHWGLWGWVGWEERVGGGNWVLLCLLPGRRMCGWRKEAGVQDMGGRWGWGMEGQVKATRLTGARGKMREVARLPWQQVGEEIAQEGILMVAACQTSLLHLFMGPPKPRSSKIPSTKSSIVVFAARIEGREE